MAARIHSKCSGQQWLEHPPQVTRQSFLDLMLGRRFWLGAQQGVHGHDKSRRAEAALGAVGLGEPLLHRVQPIPWVPDTFTTHPLCEQSCASVELAVAEEL